MLQHTMTSKYMYPCIYYSLSANVRNQRWATTNEKNQRWATTAARRAANERRNQKTTRRRRREKRSRGERANRVIMRTGKRRGVGRRSDTAAAIVMTEIKERVHRGRRQSKRTEIKERVHRGRRKSKRRRIKELMLLVCMICKWIYVWTDQELIVLKPVSDDGTFWYTKGWGLLSRIHVYSGMQPWNDLLRIITPYN